MNDLFNLFEPFKSHLTYGISREPLSKAILANQIHGDQVLEIREIPSTPPSCDGFITRKNNLSLGIRVADCQGILIYDPKTSTIAVVHAGWRGSAQNILGKAIQKMATLGSDPSDLLLAISPSLGPCCAEFTNPRQELPDFCHPYIQGKKVDFWRLSRAQAIAQGVPADQIEVAERCTRCHPGLYPSHRRGDTTRMIAFIALK